MKFSVIKSGSAIQYRLLPCIRFLYLSSADLIHAVFSFVFTQSLLKLLYSWCWRPKIHPQTTETSKLDVHKEYHSQLFRVSSYTSFFIYNFTEYRWLLRTSCEKYYGKKVLDSMSLFFTRECNEMSMVMKVICKFSLGQSVGRWAVNFNLWIIIYALNYKLIFLVFFFLKLFVSHFWGLNRRLLTSTMFLKTKPLTAWQLRRTDHLGWKLAYRFLCVVVSPLTDTVGSKFNGLYV